MTPLCKGMNCQKSDANLEHSLECEAQHAAAIAGGHFVKGNPMTKTIDALVEALAAPGCERIKDFYSVGPVQRAAVESFVEALAQARAEQSNQLSGNSGTLNLMPAAQVVGLTDADIERITESTTTYSGEFAVAVAHTAIAEFCRVNGIKPPEAKL